MPRKPKTRAFARTKEYTDLRQSILDALTARGMDTPASRAQLDEYMTFWVRRKQLQEDVEKRGVVVTDERGRTTENRSVSLEIQVSRQMLAIYQSLGLKPVPSGSRGGSDKDPYYDDDDEL